MDSRITRLADLLVNYSCAVKKGEKVLIECIGFDAMPLVHEVTRCATQAPRNSAWATVTTPRASSGSSQVPRTQSLNSPIAGPHHTW